MIKIAIQKNGRLSDLSLALLKNCGIKTQNGDRKLKSIAENFPLEILYLRDDDIPEYVEKGVADLGIIGENEVWEKAKDIEVIKQLGFAKCRMALAIAKDEKYTGVQWFQNKTIATSYPTILSQYLTKNKITAHIEVINGSVEIAPGIGLAEGIFDIVSTGSTLLMNGLMEVESVCKSQAVMVKNKNLNSDKSSELQRLLFRIDAVQKAAQSKYILLNAPNDKVAAISELLPGMKSPTVLPLIEEGWSSLHSVINEEDFWDVIEQLKILGAEGILVIPIEKMID